MRRPPRQRLMPRASVTSLARAHHVDPTRLGKLLRAAGLPATEASVRRVLAVQVQRGWTATEDKYVRSSWPQRSISEIAAKLGRSDSSVTRRLSDLRIRKQPVGMVSIRALTAEAGFADHKTVARALARAGVAVTRSGDGHGAKNFVNRKTAMAALRSYAKSRR